MSGLQLDLAPNGDGVDNQTSIEATSPLFDNDTFQASGDDDAAVPATRQLGAVRLGGLLLRVDPSRAWKRNGSMFHYRSVSMGFGLEGVNGEDTRNAVADRSLDWLLDEIELSASGGQQPLAGVH